ncbi:MAG: ABC transporter ATP-binding protein [Clostridia bacterium]|nr:ABC transporter ATP-binding protein [Clostridia bacterium]
MVNVEHVSMRFNLGIEKNFSLKQFVVESFSPSKRKERVKNKVRNEFWALKDVSFEVKRGEVMGFVGTNGAGKSTLLKIVAGVMKPTEGRVSVGGNICPMIELGAGFDIELTARENVFLNGAVMGYDKEFISSKYDGIVEFSELGDFMEVPVKNFSSGMIARLAFSIATVVDPEILIVDEILAVGDAAFQQKSEKKMKSMINGGTTVLYVSHSADSIKALCDRVVWIDHGSVQMVGPAVEVCDKYLESLNLDQ